MPEGHRPERRTRHEHHRRQRDEHRQPRESDGLAGGVHRRRGRLDRRAPVADERLAEASDDEQRVVDAQREGEHQREVHRPDRDVEQLRAEEQHPGGSHQAEDGEHQRQTRSHQRAERQQHDPERHRPRDDLGLEHRRLVGVVEVRPHPGRACEVDAHARPPAAGELVLEVVGRPHHLVGRVAAPASTTRRPAVLRDRHARSRRDDRRRPRARLAAVARPSATVAANAGSSVVSVGDETTTCSA